MAKFVELAIFYVSWPRKNTFGFCRFTKFVQFSTIFKELHLTTTVLSCVSDNVVFCIVS